jgi:hypothetical protein
MQEALYAYATQTFPLAAIAQAALGKRDEREAVHMSVVIRAQNGGDYDDRGAHERGPETPLLAWAERAYPLREIVRDIIRDAKPNANVERPFLAAMLRLAERHSPGVTPRAVADANSRIPGRRAHVGTRGYAEAKFMAICIDAVEYIPTSGMYNRTKDEKRIRSIVNHNILECKGKTSTAPASTREIARVHLGYPPRAEHVGRLFDYVWGTYDVEGLSAVAETPEMLERALRASVRQTYPELAARCMARSPGFERLPAQSSCTVL